jgi:Cohesin domain
LIHCKLAVFGCLALAVFALDAGRIRAARVVVAAGHVEGAPGKEVAVPITLKGVKEAKGVRGMSIRLNYDPAILTFKAVNEGPLLTRAIVRKDIDEKADPGKLAFGFLCDTKTPASKEFTSVQEDGVVLTVSFLVNDKATIGQKSALVLDNYRVIDTAEPPFELPVSTEEGAFIVTGPAFPWIWILIGSGILVFVVLLIALLAGRKKQQPAAALPSFAPDPAATFAHTCIQCGGVIQLPRAMAGQAFQCSACGKTQTARTL